jgi:pilus assembly protein Flp/PilA
MDHATRRPLQRIRRAACRCQGEDGQGMVEYALILMLMALVVIVLLSVVGRETNNVFSNITAGISQ